MNKHWTIPQRVDFDQNFEDFETAYLGSLGFSTVFIQDCTDFTHGQINYRLKKAGIKRRDFRDGNSPEAALLLKELAQGNLIQRSVRKTLKARGQRRTA